jgi:hypothetical protein
MPSPMPLEAPVIRRTLSMTFSFSACLSGATWTRSAVNGIAQVLGWVVSAARQWRHRMELDLLPLLLAVAEEQKFRAAAP